MQAVKISGKCQRLDCDESETTTLFRIDGELFVADAERGVEAGYRLYCRHCTAAILGAVGPYKQLGSVKL